MEDFQEEVTKLNLKGEIGECQVNGASWGRRSRQGDFHVQRQSGKMGCCRTGSKRESRKEVLLPLPASNTCGSHWVPGSPGWRTRACIQDKPGKEILIREIQAAFIQLIWLN